MSNPEVYINHPLNNSATKQTFTFPKAERFHLKRRSMGDIMYELPSCRSNRSCTFGFGSKTNFTEKEKSPPPGTYEPPSDFSKPCRNNTISFSLGRNQVKFSNFLYEAVRAKALPSPSSYRIKTEAYYCKRGGKMAAKLPTEIELKANNKVPGPGSYKLDVTEMKGSGSYILSHYHNNTSPKYVSPPRSRSKSPSQAPSLGPGQYQVAHEKFGHSLVSKFKNSITSVFSKQQRPGPEDKSKIKFPGFKYKKFSEFRGIQG